MGALTEMNLETLRADIAFIGGDAVDHNGNIYNHSLEVARMLNRMAASAQRVFAVVDSSKIGKTALAPFGKIARWDGLITDNGLSRSVHLALRRAGVHVMKATARKGE
jgi:DeoR/GlpR family transcriptional regulator of sugar metabolism